MPSWLSDFLSDSLLYSPFYAVADAIWRALMGACTGIIEKTPQTFSSDAWTYVRYQLYPWALAIGVASLNLFLIIGFFKAIANFKENVTMERITEFLIKVVILNVLLLNGLVVIRTIFNVSSALAGEILTIELPELFTQEADIGARLFFYMFGFLYFLVALICGLIIFMTLYGRYIKLYMLVVFYPLAVPTLVGGGQLEHTAYAWLKSFLSSVLEIIAIALVMGICGRIVGGVSSFTDNIIVESFDGFGSAIKSLIYMILMAASVGKASSFLNKTFNL